MSDEAIKAEDKKPETKTEDGWHLPGYVRDITKRVLYVVVPILVVGGGALFIDNVRNKDAIAYESFRNNQQDEQIAQILANQKRLELRQDRAEERAADEAKETQEFQSVVLDGLQKLMKWMRR